MNPDANDLQDRIAALALGIASDEDRAMLEELALADPSISREIEVARAAVDVMAHDVPVCEPPPELRARLLAEVRPVASVIPLSSARDRVAGDPNRRRWAWPAVAAALALLVVGLVGWNLTLRGDTAPGDPDVASVAVAATASAPGATGRVVIVKDGTLAVVTLDGLPAAGPGEGHELWVLRAGVPTSAGFLRPLPGGAFVGVATDLDGVDQVAVTIEPRGNTAAPTGAPLVAANI